VVNGYVPDAYVYEAGPYRLVLGEAKTAADIDTRHSADQIKAFIKYCQMIGSSLLVLAVPWDSTVYMRNKLSVWGRRERFDVSCCRVLDWLTMNLDA
jgi:hypothetical protein